MAKEQILDQVEKEIFDKISAKEINGLKALLTQLKGSVNFTSENGMSPLQHACFTGNKDIVQMLVDQGADVNFSNQQGSEYTPLHFAALSGNVDTILILLLAGANPNAVNSVSRTPSQMAAFVGNHHCVSAINGFVPKSEIEYYTKIQGQQDEPYLPAFLLDSFHKFLIRVSLHPVRIALNLNKTSNLLGHLKKCKKVLELMIKREMGKTNNINEIFAFKFHYLAYIFGKLLECEKDHPTDFIKLFIRRVLKPNKSGQLDYLDYLIKEATGEFAFRECTIFRQLVSQLSSKDAYSAIEILKNAINGQRGFTDEIKLCDACGEEGAANTCSKCKQTHYCDQECQRIHWFVHKKECSRLPENETNPDPVELEEKNANDSEKIRGIREEIKALL